MGAMSVCCCCCCCCRHIKRPSGSAQSRGGASDADVFRGHRLTALMWGEKGNDKTKIGPGYNHTDATQKN